MQGKLRRLGREAAGRGHKGTGKRPAPSPAASEADSEEDEDAAEEEGEEEAYQAVNDGSSVRRTRQASSRKDAAPESKRKSKLKVSDCVSMTTTILPIPRCAYMLRVICQDVHLQLARCAGCANICLAVGQHLRRTCRQQYSTMFSCIDDPEHDLQGRTKSHVIGVSEAEQAKRDNQATGRSRVKREKEEHAARGPVPEPCRDFRLPQSRVPALLMVWELTQVATSFLSRKCLYTWSCAYLATAQEVHHTVYFQVQLQLLTLSES